MSWYKRNKEWLHLAPLEWCQSDLGNLGLGAVATVPRSQYNVVSSYMQSVERGSRGKSKTSWSTTALAGIVL